MPLANETERGKGNYSNGEPFLPLSAQTCAIGKIEDKPTDQILISEFLGIDKFAIHGR